MMDNMTYEQAIKRLEEIVSLLENGEVSLDDSIKLYEESAKLSAFCNDLLNKAELKIEEFNKDRDEEND
jgi:exodeoxyribonuclease VII small subunit